MGLPQAVEIPNDFRPARAISPEQAAWYARSTVPAHRTSHGSLAERVFLWHFPWTRKGYPGFRKGILAIIGRTVTWGAVAHWRAGRRKLPVDVAICLAENIEARAANGLALAQELRNYVATEEAALVHRGSLSTVSFDAAGNPRTNQSKGGRVY